MDITILDGPIGTALIQSGHAAPAPAWSAAALIAAPNAVAELHQRYAQAGATHHTTNTFRTRPSDVGPQWAQLATEAVRLTRSSIPITHQVMGSMAPIADCYRPDLSPPNPGPQHRELAQVLSKAGVDLILCETFPHIGEGLAAAEAALSTDTPTWLSFTAGPEDNLLSSSAIARGTASAAALGVSAILVNCVPATSAERYLDAIAGHGIPFGIYANAGSKKQGIGWGAGPDGPARYVELAHTWVERGATLIGSCCGTGPEHIRALYSAFRRDD